MRHPLPRVSHRAGRRNKSTARAALPSIFLSLVSPQHDSKCLSWDVDFAEAFHAFFAFGLFGEHLFLARDVAAVQANGHVFAKSADVFSGDKFAANGRLQAHRKLLAGNDFFEFY